MYIYKCSNCGNKWKDENPEICPKCTSENFEIIGEGGGRWKKIILILFFLLLVSSTVLFFILNNNSQVKKIDLIYITQSNYVEIKTDPEIKDFSKYGFEAKILNNNLTIENGKIYPCSSGQITVTWNESNEKYIINEKNSPPLFDLVGDFHSNSGCNEDKGTLVIMGVDYDPVACNYIVDVSYTKNDKVLKNKNIPNLLVKFEQGNWQSSNRISFEKAGEKLGLVQVKLENSESTYEYEYNMLHECIESSDCNEFTKDAVVTKFNELNKGSKFKSIEFRKYLQNSGCATLPLINFKGEDYQFQSFLNKIKTKSIKTKGTKVRDLVLSNNNSQVDKLFIE